MHMDQSCGIIHICWRFGRKDQSMTASHNKTEAFTLIRTKLQQPWLPGGLIPRQRLLDRIHAGSDRKLMLIDTFGDNGGLIVNGAASGIPEEAKPENVRAITEAVLEFGVYG